MERESAVSELIGERVLALSKSGKRVRIRGSGVGQLNADTIKDAASVFPVISNETQAAALV